MAAETLTDRLLANLLTGKKRARTSPELAACMGISGRELRKIVKEARRQGAPICASSKKAYCGLYLAADAEELEEYIEMIGRRAKDLYITRQALIKQLKQYREQETADE